MVQKKKESIKEKNKKMISPGLKKLFKDEIIPLIKKYATYNWTDIDEDGTSLKELLKNPFTESEYTSPIRLVLIRNGFTLKRSRSHGSTKINCL